MNIRDRLPLGFAALRQTFSPLIVECPCLRELQLCHNCSRITKRLLELFKTRDDIYAAQYEDKNETDLARRFKYHPVREPLTQKVVEDHLRGLSTIGFYQLDTNSKVRWICFDIDTHDKEPVRKLLKAIVKNGIPPEALLVENSGAKGRHVWIFLAEATPAKLARQVALKIRGDAGLDFAEKFEIFPRQDKIEEDGLGNLVKLPLGKHLRTLQRATILDVGRDFEPIDWPDLADKLERVVSASLAEEKDLSRRPINASEVTLPECATVIPEGMRDFYFYSLANALKKKYPRITTETSLEVLEPLRERSNRDAKEPFTQSQLNEKIRRFIEQDKASFPIYTICKYGKQAGLCPHKAGELCSWIGEQNKPIELSELGRKFLMQRDLHERTANILDTTIVGERDLKMLCFYVGLGAAIHARPSGIIIVDTRGGGKSHCETMIVGLFPSERVEQPTSFAEHSLNYLAGNYEGKIIRVDELFGVGEALPDLRVWMTNGRLERVLSPTSEQREAGQKEAEKVKVEGCPVFFTSTTHNVEEQLGSRNWMAHVDTSKQQTARIHARQTVSDMFPPGTFSIQSDTREFLRELIKWALENAKPVLVPFGYTFPAEDPRTRRDRGRFTALIKDIANWYQLQRETWVAPNGQGFIIADPRDFGIALKIAKPYLLESLTSLDKKGIQVLRALADADADTGATIREIVQNTNLADKTVRRRMNDLLAKGYALEIPERPTKYASTKKARNIENAFLIRMIALKEGARIIERLKSGAEPEKLLEIVGELEDQLSREYLRAPPSTGIPRALGKSSAQNGDKMTKTSVGETEE